MADSGSIVQGGALPAAGGSHRAATVGLALLVVAAGALVGFVVRLLWPHPRGRRD